MKKVFISQLMNGRTDNEILQEREEALNNLKAIFNDDSIEVIDSFFQSAPHDAKPLWFLGKSLELLANADIAYFCNGWDKGRGCKVEHLAAVLYDIPVIEADNIKTE